MKNKKIHQYEPERISKSFDGTYFITACGRRIKGQLICGEWFMDYERMTTDKDAVTCLQCKNRRVLKK